MSDKGSMAISNAPNPPAERTTPITDAAKKHCAHKLPLDLWADYMAGACVNLERQLAEVIEQRDAAEKIAGQVDGLKRRIAELNYRLDRSCVWTEDEDGNWDTGCGECFSFAIGGKHAVYCCHCGGKIISKEYRFEQQEE